MLLSERIKYYTNLNSQLNQQLEIISEEFKLAEKKLNNHQDLFKNAVISELKMDEITTAYLQTKRNYENSKINIINNEISISNLEEQLIQLEIDFKTNIEQLKFTVNDSYLALISDVNDWKQSYLLESPIEGTVTFLDYWKDGQFVQSGNLVMIVVPKEEELIGRVKMPVVGSGKVKIGQTANIRLDNYPDKDFGMVKGLVESISLVPENENYTIILSLPNGLTTSYKKQLLFKQEMSGTAEIITEDLRLLQRIFDNIRNLVDN
jgi:multidrug resistance efflux pump